MKKGKLILIILSIFAFFMLACLSGGYLYYKASLSPVDDESKENVVFTVKAGEPANLIIANLKKEGLIKDEFVMKVYVKLHPGSPQAGEYVLSKNMSATEIYDAFLNGKVTYNTKWVTFVEGKRLSYIEDVIAKNFDFSKEEIESVLENRDYIKKLITKYNFLTDDILKEGIYHPLEGYLFPDTYEFLESVSIEEIIEKMLDNTEAKLSGFTTEIAASKFNIHEIMTLASIVELEGARSNDRSGVAGVFYNRLKAGWTLGSDVTTYYAVGKDFSVDLTWTDLNSCNGYNTRGSCVKGLPIGPIATPSFDSLKATLMPKSHDYYYFVADKYGKTYFNKSDAAHNAEVNRLKREGLWYTY